MSGQNEFVWVHSAKMWFHFLLAYLLRLHN